MIRAALLLAAAALVTAPAIAGTPSQQSQPTAKPDKPQDKLVCKFINTTGSRLSRDRVCMTRSQWQAQEDAEADGLQQGLGRATGDATNGSH
jgi:hypothetical protein